MDGRYPPVHLPASHNTHEEIIISQLKMLVKMAVVVVVIRETGLACRGTQSNYGTVMNSERFLVQNWLAVDKSAISRVTN
jgi:hypothetical protein